MSNNSTVFKATLQIADMNRNYYHDHLLTIARHASETDERMMVRLLAFSLNANDALVFANGLSENDEADIWQKDLIDNIEIWIDVGLPDEKFIRKACGRAKHVYVYTYGGRVANIWWDKARAKLEQIKNLSVINISTEDSQAMATLAERGMKLYYTINEESILISANTKTITVNLIHLKN